MGKNYRNFEPLNHFAQRFAREYFGEIHQMIFCDSLESKNNVDNAFLISLEFGLKYATNLLILAPHHHFNTFLSFIKVKQEVENYKEVPIDIAKEIFIKSEFILKSKVRRVWLLDLQNIFFPKVDKQSAIKVHFHQNISPTMFLYLLGIDALSAQILLDGIAKDFKVNLEILNADSNLEVLSATSNNTESLKDFAKVIETTFMDKIFPTFNLAQSVIDLLLRHHLKITTAESCTGGLVAYWLTKESGASEVFDGGVVSYANAIKESWLEVSKENLEHFGAVSEAVVREMLEGALRLSGADFALATSGIAGPNGGSANKPVGTIFIGIKDRKGAEIIEQLHLKGDRNYIQTQATIYAYLLFLKVFLLNY